MFSFGGNNTSTSTASNPSGGFSFGGNTATTTTPSTSTSNSTSLFGNTSNATSTGSTVTAPASGFSFGATSSTPATSAATSTPSLFGNTASAPTGTSLFGNTSGSTPTSTTFTLSTPNTTGGTPTGLSLGSTTTTTSTPSTSLFGNTNPSGSVSNATNTSTSSAPLNPQTIARTTKFSELPEDAKKMIEQIEKSIQSQIHSHDYVTARETPDFINKVTEEAQGLNEKLVGLKFSLERDMELISNLNKTMNREIKNAEIAGRGINALKSPNNHLVHFPGVRLTFDYFWNLVTSFESRMLQYKHNIEDIEKHLSSIAQTAKFSPGALTEIMRNQHETFLAIAGKVATLHSAVKRQKEQYLNYRRRIFNDDKSPFPDDRKKSKLPKLSDDSESLMISMLQPTASTNQAPQGSNATSSSLFGSTQSTGSTFGASAPSTGGLFGQSTTSPFGSSTSASATSNTGGSLFGNTSTATSNTTTPTGGLFGASTTAPSTGGLFGASTTAPSTGGLFGASSTAPSTGGLFGSSTTTPSTGGLFGGSTTTPSTGGLFGSNNATAKPTTGFSFGAK